MAKLEEETRIQLNLVKGLILSQNPKLRIVTDDYAIYKALKSYRGVLNGQ